MIKTRTLLIAVWSALVTLIIYYLITTMRRETFVDTPTPSGDTPADVIEKRLDAATCALRSLIVNSSGTNNILHETEGPKALAKALAAQGFIESTKGGPGIDPGYYPGGDLYMKLKTALAFIGYDPKPFNTASLRALLVQSHFTDRSKSNHFTEKFSADDKSIAAKSCPSVPSVTATQKAAMIKRRAQLLACALKDSKTEAEYTAEMTRMGVTEPRYASNSFIFMTMRQNHEKGLDEAKITPLMELFVENELIVNAGRQFADVESAALECKSKSKTTAPAAPAAPAAAAPSKVELPPATPRGKKHAQKKEEKKKTQENENKNNKTLIYFIIAIAVFLLIGIIIAVLKRNSAQPQIMQQQPQMPQQPQMQQPNPYPNP
jgi:hypothetical protein